MNEWTDEENFTGVASHVLATRNNVFSAYANLSLFS